MGEVAALTGILLVQLGTPDAPTEDAYRAYLREFLSDPRVIERQGLAWQLVLRFLVLPGRAGPVVRNYREIWDPAAGSPLLSLTRRQAEGLAGRIGPSASVRWAMRYGRPKVDEAFDAFAAEGVDRIVVLPLYPQYSATSTASAYDDVFRALSRRRFVPTVRFVPPFYAHPEYLAALAARVRETVVAAGFEPERYVYSFHGIPVSYAERGDPYAEHCRATADGLTRALGLPTGRAMLTFQSQFGREPWLDPKTEGSLVALAREGVRRVLVTNPGFTTDCLETIFEIGREVAEAFHEAGGETLLRVPCLNDHPRWMEALEAIVRQESAGWL